MVQTFRLRFEVAILCSALACAGATGCGGPEAAARAAEQALHAACDEWARAQAKGEDTAPAAAKIRRSYADFSKNILKTHYPTSSVYLILTDITAAGRLDLPDGSNWSYLLRGTGGLGMTVFKREEWQTDRLPPRGGLYLSIKPPDLRSKFSVEKVQVIRNEQTVLRVFYKLKDMSGVIGIRRIGKRWRALPDRGIVGPDDWWRPSGNLTDLPSGASVQRILSSRLETLTRDTFRRILDSASPTPVDAPILHWQSVPWANVRFKTEAGEFSAELMRGGIGFLTTPDGKHGCFKFTRQRHWTETWFRF